MSTTTLPTVPPVTETETKDKDTTMARTRPPAAAKPPAAAAKPPKPPAAKAKEGFTPAPVTFYWPGYETFGRSFIFLEWVNPSNAPVVGIGFAYLGYSPDDINAVRVVTQTAKGSIGGGDIKVSPADQAKAKAKVKAMLQQVKDATGGTDPQFEAWFSAWKKTPAGASRELDAHGKDMGKGTLGEHIDKVRRGKAGQAGAALSPAAQRMLGMTTMPTRPSSVPKNFRRKSEDGSEAVDAKAEAEQAAFLAAFFK